MQRSLEQRQEEMRLRTVLRVCSKCHKKTPLGAFVKRGDSVRSVCKKCWTDRQNAYDNRPDKVLPRKIARYRKDAMRRGFSWDLSDRQAGELLTGQCHYCGREGGGIDRVDNSKGYAPENAVSCCYRCNVAKHTQSSEQFIAMCVSVAVRHHK